MNIHLSIFKSNSYPHKIQAMVALKAPKGKFRVIGVDTFNGANWIQGDFDTKEKAFDKATHNFVGCKMNVYDDKGKLFCKSI